MVTENVNKYVPLQTIARWNDSVALSILRRSDFGYVKIQDVQIFLQSTKGSVGQELVSL